jgi:hypothetical protein
MASHVTSEVVIQIGDLPTPVGTQVSLDLVTGLQHVSAHKEQIRSRTGEDPLDFKLYLTIPAASPDSAEKLSGLLKKTLTDAVNAPDTFVGGLYHKIKPDPDEPALLDFEIKVFGSNVVIVNTATQNEEQASAMFGMAVEQSGGLFLTSNSLHVELDLGRSIGEILTPQLSQTLTESVLAKIVFTHDPAALLHARETLKNLGADKKLIRGLGLASIFNGATLRFNFKSGSYLPEHAQTMLNSLSGLIPPLDQVLPSEILTFIHGVIELAGHEIYVNLVAGNVAKQVHLSVKGASQIFQKN